MVQAQLCSWFTYLGRVEREALVVLGRHHDVAGPRGLEQVGPVRRVEEAGRELRGEGLVRPCVVVGGGGGWGWGGKR